MASAIKSRHLVLHHRAGQDTDPQRRPARSRHPNRTLPVCCLPTPFSKQTPSVFKANNQRFGPSWGARKTFASFTCATTEPSQLSQVCNICRKTQMGIHRAAWTEKSYLRRRAGEAEAEEGLEDALVLLLCRPAHAVVAPRPQQEAHQLPRQLVQRHRQTRLGGSSEKKSGRCAATSAQACGLDLQSIYFHNTSIYGHKFGIACLTQPQKVGRSPEVCARRERPHDDCRQKRDGRALLRRQRLAK
jgi:hypothetical protein